MTIAVLNLLKAFDSLTDAEKQEAAAEVLRRSPPIGTGHLPDLALVTTADELFRALDADEAAHGQP